MDIDAQTPDLVMVGIDGSDAGQVALAWAAAEAAARGGPLRLVHCWQPPDRNLVALPGAWPARAQAGQAEAAAGTTLDAALGWLREHHGDLPVGTDLLHGPAGPTLTAHVRSNDLLVLGMNSRHRLTARLLGSTLEHLLRHARCPMVVVPATTGPSDDPRGPFARHVVAAVRDPQRADDAAEMATISAVLGGGFAHAARHGVPLDVVHTDPRRPDAVGCVVGWASPVTPSTVRQPLNRAIDSWHARYPQVKVRRVTISGPPDPVLGRVTAGARLLVIGRSSHPLRPVRLVDHLLADTRCPVAVIPPTPVTAHVVPSPALRLPDVTHPAWSTT